MKTCIYCGEPVEKKDQVRFMRPDTKVEILDSVPMHRECRDIDEDNHRYIIREEFA